MKRLIVDYNKLNTTVLDLLVKAYPDGYGDEDIIAYRNAQGEMVECIRVNTDDSVYLVKVSKRLILAMEDHEIEDDDDLADDPDMNDTGEDMDEDYSADEPYDPYDNDEE